MAVNESAAEPSNESGGAGSVQAVGVAFAVLESLSQTPDAIGTSELARRLGLTKARIHRHLSTLRELGFVEKDSTTDGYRLGWKSYKLGMAVAENFGLRRIAHRHLLRLHKDSGQTVALCMPAGPEAVTVVETLESTGVIAITVKPGSIIPASTAALGRAILAFRDGQGDEASLQNVREDWFAVAVNERLPGVAALAAPVFDDTGQAVASVGVIGSQAHITDPPPADLLEQVQDAAAHISAALRSTRWQQVPRSRSVPRRTSPGDKA